MTELYLVRHGRTFANEAGLKQGQINDERTYLNETGRKQAQKLAQQFDLAGFTKIYVSPLKRTLDTATILNQKAHLPVTTDDRLLEISYGKWDGQYNQVLMEQYPQLFSPLVKDVKPQYFKTAGGESFADVEKRVAAFTKDVVRTYPNEKILVVTHGFTVRSFAINAVKSAGLAILEPGNCSVSKILIDPNSLTQNLVYYNRSVTGFKK